MNKRADDNENVEAAEGQEAAPAKKKGGSKIIIIVLALLIVVAAAAVYFLVLAPGDDDGEASSGPKEETYYALADFIVTNLQQGESGKFLAKVTLSLGLAEDVEEEYMINNIAAIRDRIIYVLRGHTVEDFATPDALTALNEELVAAINEELQAEIVTRCYFYDFVTQAG